MFRRISFLATSDVSKTLVVISECLMHKSSPLWGKCNNFILQVDFVQIVRLLVGSGDKFLFQLMTEGSKFTDVNSMYDLMHYHIPLLYCSWFQFHWIKMAYLQSRYQGHCQKIQQLLGCSVQYLFSMKLLC